MADILCRSPGWAYAYGLSSKESVYERRHNDSIHKDSEIGKRLEWCLSRTVGRQF